MELDSTESLKGFAGYLAEDFYDIFPDGKERTKSELLEFLSGAELKEYRLSNFRVTMLNQDEARFSPYFCSSTRRERTHVGDRCESFGHLRVARQIRHKFLLILRHQRRRLHSE